MNDICDSHFHVFGDPEHYPMVATRGYNPPLLSIADHEARFGAYGVGRRVLIQPSCYGADNRCQLDALATLGKNGRAVVAVAPDVSDSELKRMHALGVRGIRVNAVGGSTLSIAQLNTVAPRLASLGWHVQTYVPIGTLPDVADALLATGLPIVLDHFGSPDTRLGLDQPAMQTLAHLLATGRCWVKLSAAFRISRAGAPFTDLQPYARALMQMRSDRLVWGSDWPYIHFIDKLPADFDPLEFFAGTFSDAAEIKALLSDNARVLYQFD